MPTAPVSRTRDHAVVMLFAAVSFLGATLLFSVELLVAKMLLPRLGGTPATWNTSMVFFQASLLVGYLLAHFTLSRLSNRAHRYVQIAALVSAAIVLPVSLPDGWRLPEGASPTWWTFTTLVVMIGAPFVMLSTTGPTLQRWFTSSGHPRSNDPYFLYATNNTGSLLALLSYPFLVERFLSIPQQTTTWAVMYGVFIAGTAACAWLSRSGSDERAATNPADDAAPVTNRQRLRWAYIAAVPSILMLAVTTYIGTDVASMPLLWVVPLSLYLLTFILAFGRAGTGQLERRSGRALKGLMIPVSLTMYVTFGFGWGVFALVLTTFFVAGLVAHTHLASTRPAASQLTEFYLWVAVGGVLGGIATALIAPAVFDAVTEYPIAVILAVTTLPASVFVQRSRTGSLVPVQSWKTPAVLTRAAVLAALVAAIGYLFVQSGTDSLAVALPLLFFTVIAVTLFSRTPRSYALAMTAIIAVPAVLPTQEQLFTDRTFFGVHRVLRSPDGNRHTLINGTTIHGIEDLAGPSAGQPSTYFYRSGPIGQVFSALEDRPPLTVGIVGLGTGSMAAFGRPGDRITFYEIDQTVIDIATNPDLFTFIDRSPAAVDFQIGDARLEMAAKSDARYDLIVIDAFSGDAIPVHLLTNEAVTMYREHLNPGGVLVFHISNRFLKLEPVVARLAAEQGIPAFGQHDEAITPQDKEAGKTPSHWIAMTTDPAAVPRISEDVNWRALPAERDAPLWTDDFSDLTRVLLG